MIPSDFSVGTLTMFERSVTCVVDEERHIRRSIYCCG
jgi:hypothetical protein